MQKSDKDRNHSTSVSSCSRSVLLQINTSEAASKWGNRERSLPRALLESQLFKWEGVGDNTDTYYDSGTLTLITHWSPPPPPPPPFVIICKDKTFPRSIKHHKRFELAKSVLCCGMVWVFLVANCFRFLISGSGTASMYLLPEGQVEPEGLLIDQVTLAWSFLLCPQGMQASLSPSLKSRNHCDECGRGRGVYKNRGDKALCHSSSQLDRRRGIGVSWAGLEGGGVL